MISRIFFLARELSSMFFEPRMAALRPSLTDVILLMSSLRKSVAVFQSLDELALNRRRNSCATGLLDAKSLSNLDTVIANGTF